METSTATTKATDLAGSTTGTTPTDTVRLDGGRDGRGIEINSEKVSELLKIGLDTGAGFG